MNNRKIIVAMPTEDDFMPSISRWGHAFDWTGVEVHFVHVVTKTFEASEMTVQQFPSNRLFEGEIKPATLEFLMRKARSMMPEQASDNARFEVLFDRSPADRLASYAREVHADMVVVATRHKKGIVGFFTSSFANRMLQLCPCDLLILRPEKQG